VERKLGQGSTFHLTLPVFSLDKLCADIFTAPNLQAGSVTLTRCRRRGRREHPGWCPAAGTIGPGALYSCWAGWALALGWVMPSRGETFFIAACTGPNGFEVIASRIRRELQSFDRASRLEPVTFVNQPARSRRPVHRLRQTLEKRD